MKKLGLFFAFVLFTSLAVMAQKPLIVFNEKEFDFSKIKEADGNVSHVFEFTNKGDAPLVVTQVKASCGCTTPEWTKSPVAPGKKGTIKVTYSTANRPGMFSKLITVTSNDTVSKVVLTIKGEVIGK